MKSYLRLMGGALLFLVFSLGSNAQGDVFTTDPAGSLSLKAFIHRASLSPVLHTGNPRSLGILEGSDSLPPASFTPNDVSRSQDNINYGRLAVLGGGLLTVGVAHQLYVQNAWWKDYRGPFHFREDLHYARNVDKVGHIYAGMVTSFLGGKAMEWSGFRPEKAVWYGAAIGSLFELYIEIQDGFSTLWGFDRVDAAANIAGAFLPVAKYYVPFFDNIDLKFSYLPSNAEPPRGGPFQNQKRLVVDDYEGQRFWLSIKVGNLLPSPLKSAWPDFLGIALGLGVRDLQRGGGQMQWYVALDYDLTKLPGDSGFLKAVKEGLNFIHLPSPAIRISPSVILYGLYFSL